MCSLDIDSGDGPDRRPPTVPPHPVGAPADGGRTEASLLCTRILGNRPDMKAAIPAKEGP